MNSHLNGILVYALALLLPHSFVTEPLHGQSDLQNAQTEYVFRENGQIAYLVQIDYTHTLGKTQWMGVVAFSTSKPTPLRSDGSGYDYASVNTLGILVAFDVKGDGELKRDRSRDILLPKTLNFRPMGVSSHKMPSGGNKKLPGNMHRALGVVEAIFPKVPLFEGQDRRDISRNFWLQTTYGMGEGSLSQVKGKGTRMESAVGNRAETQEQLKVVDKEGNQLFAYNFHQVAMFNGNRQMTGSTTLYQNSESGTVDNVVITTRQVEYAQALKVAETMQWQ